MIPGYVRCWPRDWTKTAGADEDDLDCDAHFVMLEIDDGLLLFFGDLLLLMVHAKHDRAEMLDFNTFINQVSPVLRSRLETRDAYGGSTQTRL